jgi:hypothetical protein
MATTGYFASAQTNDMLIGIQREATWGTAPTSGTYTGMRVQSCSLGEQKNRTRPGEIRNDMQVSAAVTQDVQASGSIPFAVSYGNQDLIWPTLFTGDWTADLAISNTGLSADNSGSTFDGSAGDFDDVLVGQWIKVAGFATSGANGYFLVTEVAVDGSSITVSPAPSSDANGGSNTITVNGSQLVNGTTVNTLSIQERYSDSLGFMYSGCIASGGQINAARGQYFSGTCDLIAKSEAKAASVVGTMGAAPTNRVFNTTANMTAVSLGGSASAKVMSLTTTITREGAAANFALGSEAAVGVVPGSFSASGQVQIYFSDNTEYDLYKAETQVQAYYQVTDAAGNAYIVDLPKVVLGRVTKERSGPNQPVMATFEFMADPDPDLGWTMAINRFAAA